MNLSKKCFKCKKIKPINEFYKHGGMVDKHLNKCKECAKLENKKRYYDPLKHKLIIEYEKNRSKKIERLEKMREYHARERKEYPEKFQARHKTSNAIRDGKLKKQSCIICNNPDSEIHHNNYKEPFNIMWLCRKCHKQKHLEPF